MSDSLMKLVPCEWSATVLRRLRWEYEHRDNEGKMVTRVAESLLKSVQWGACEVEFWRHLHERGRDAVDETREEWPLMAVVKALDAVGVGR